MKPTQDDLCHAIIAFGAESCASDSIQPATLNRLCELKLATMADAGYKLSSAGNRLLRKLMNEEDVGDFS